MTFGHRFAFLAAIGLMRSVALGYSFGVMPQSIPSAGINVHLPQGAKPLPIPSVAASRYVLRQGDRTWEESRYDVHALWVTGELLGRWEGKGGCTLELAGLNTLEPAGGGEVTQETYAEVSKLAEKITAASDDATLSAWIRAFSGANGSLAKTSGGIAIGDARKVTFPDSVAVLFRLKNPQKSDKWFYAKFGGVKSAEVQKVIKEFLAGVTSLIVSKQSSKELGGGAIGSRIMGTTRNKDDSPRIEAARQSIAGAGNWWMAESDEYLILSDMPKITGARFVREALRQQGAMCKAYARYVPPKNKVGKGIVRVFNGRGDYVAYLKASSAGNGLPIGSCGLWDPSREELLVLAEGDRENALSTMRHEAFHQYWFYAFKGSDKPMWFTEGMATLFENVKYAQASGKVQVIDEGNRAQWVNSNPHKYAQLAVDAIGMDRSAFYSGNVADNYVASWFLCYFLTKGVPSTKGFEKYSKVVDTLVNASDMGAAEANDLAWKTCGTDTLAKDLENFWSRRTAARRYEPGATGK